MIPWKTKIRPTPDTEGQLHVDDLGKVWEWHTNNRESKWVLRDDLVVKKVKEQTFYMKDNNRVTTPPATLRRFCPGQLKNEWDMLYSKALIEINFPWYPLEQSSAKYNLTRMTWAELQAWLFAQVPHTVSAWTKNPTISIYEVFEAGDSKVIAYNSMYSSARGASAYNRSYGRAPDGLAKNFGTGLGFTGGCWAGSPITEPGRDCLNKVFPGLNAPSHVNSSKVIRFQASRRNLYHQPKTGSLVTMNGNGTRWAYNALTSTYMSIPSTEFVVGDPVFMGIANLNLAGRNFYNMRDLRGAEVFRSKLQGVLVFPLSSGDYRAIFMKPYGVDTLGIGHKIDADWKVVAEYVHTNSERAVSHKIIEPKLIVDGGEGDWDAWDECHLVNFYESIGFPSAGTNVGIDDRRISDFIQFYALHLPTGRRSEIFSRRLRTVRRRNHITMCLVPELIS